MTLKGQNFRIFLGDKVVGMATNCTCTLNGNTEDASHKDLVSMAQEPSIVSKSWSVSVESLDVTDIATVLTAIKNQTPFTLKWDETAITDNQTALAASYSRTGTAFLNDVTFTWDDRTNSTKSLQFAGSGPLKKIVGEPTHPVITPSTTCTKGQFVRLFLGSDNTATPSKVIAAAKQLSLHVSMTLEDATTKDTDGDWQVQEPTGLAYDISTTALIRSGDTITSSVGAQALPEIEEIYEGSEPVKWFIANVSGANQRTKGDTIVSGSVVLTQLTLNGPNRQNADYTAAFTGFGPYEVEA